MRHASVCVIGAGPAGILAAISAARRGRSVVLCDKMPLFGKKLIASGNGKCNLLNEKLDESHYNEPSRNLVKSIFEQFGKEEIRKFFGSLGLLVYSQDDGRIFPATNQSASVLRVLEIELKRLAIPVELNFDAAYIESLKDGFTVRSGLNKKISADSVILTGGGMSYPALGSDGSAYKLARAFGHSIVKPVPAAVPVIVKSPICHMLQGQKISARVKTIINKKIVNQMSGDLLFAKYGLSGTVILDVSDDISIAINRFNKKEVELSIDTVPALDGQELQGEIARRLASAFLPDELIAGILPNKFAKAFKVLLDTKDARKIAGSLKDMRFKVDGTRGWNEAEFTAGGITVSEVKIGTLESRMRKGLYLAGEVLDVNGRRGGYNLAWAWASGYVAGLGS